MNLSTIANEIETLKDNLCIYAKKPWNENSEVELLEVPMDQEISKKFKQIGFSYFLEISVANEVLSVFEEKQVSTQMKCQLLIHYAENDALPEWAFD